MILHQGTQPLLQCREPTFCCLLATVSKFLLVHCLWFKEHLNVTETKLMPSPTAPVVHDLTRKCSKNKLFSRKINWKERETHNPEKPFQKENEHGMKLLVNQSKPKMRLALGNSNKDLGQRTLKQQSPLRTKATRSWCKIKSIKQRHKGKNEICTRH